MWNVICDYCWDDVVEWWIFTVFEKCLVLNLCDVLYNWNVWFYHEYNLDAFGSGSNLFFTTDGIPRLFVG